MPRFVVLQHDHPERLHWDFMLDQGESLATWALPMPPTLGHVLQAQLLADHRRDYLDYEGPVSGDRGTVVRWDEGEFEWVERSVDCVVVDLRGGKIAGRVRLEATGDTPTAFRWRLSTD
jgi:DNA polymerase Ligase (LigD)